MVAFIEGHGLHRLPGDATHDIPSVLWEGRGNPNAWERFCGDGQACRRSFRYLQRNDAGPRRADALIEEAGEMNCPD